MSLGLGVILSLRCSCCLCLLWNMASISGLLLLVPWTCRLNGAALAVPIIGIGLLLIVIMRLLIWLLVCVQGAFGTMWAMWQLTWLGVLRSCVRLVFIGRITMLVYGPGSLVRGLCMCLYGVGISVVIRAVFRWLILSRCGLAVGGLVLL